MLDLPDVTLIAVDTANHALALRALERSRRDICFARTLFLSCDVPSAINIPTGIEFAPIEALATRDAYSAFVLKDLLRFVTTSHALLVQWDGYVVNPLAWEPAFLDCDYIGAKWFWQPEGQRVGNGGFSLRSRKLLTALRDTRISLVDNEDLTIGVTFRALLESEHGIRFASEDVADRFAFEAAYPIGKPFGFHGLFNFCRVVPAEELAALAESFSPSIARSLQMAQLIRNCVALGQWRPAIALARRRLAELPTDSEAMRLLQQAENSARAAPAAGRNDPCPCGSGKRFKHCHGVLGVAPSSDDLVKRGIDAHRRGQLDAAERDYRAILAQAPDQPLALHYLGVIAYQRGNARDALPLLERAAILRAEEPEFHNNLGLALVDLDRYDEAIGAYERALSLNAANATAWNNLGLALTGCNRLADAIEALRHAVSLRPDFGEAHWNLALALLGNGDFAEGWREYEWRLSLPALSGSMRVPPSPRWNGEDIAGETLLLIAEQGLGDALQFIRFAERIAARGILVTVRASARLIPLLAAAPGVTDVSSFDDPFPAHDMHLPLASIGYALNVDSALLATTRFPYLTADTASRQSVFEEVNSIAKGAYKIGVAWRAGTRGDANDRRRCCPLSALEPLFDANDVAWFSLQARESELEIDAAVSAVPLVRLDARNDLKGTAALAAAMDLVISVDTSIAHLAGALARPTWIMLPYAADWRWRASGTETAWYPTARLFRQQRRGDWASVVSQLRETLAAQFQHR